MPHSNTVFRDILKLVPWTKFDRLVKNHGTDELVRSFTTKRQLIALLFGQLSGASSLREIEASMSSNQARLLRARPSPTPTAPAYAKVFSGLFMHMLGMAARLAASLGMM